MSLVRIQPGEPFSSALGAVAPALLRFGGLRKLRESDAVLSGFLTEEPVRQIVYFSTAAGRQDKITIAGILAVSRDYNLRQEVSGLLVAGGYRYLQVIEGPERTVDALVERIRRDRRHVGVSVLVDRKIARRSFGGWSMAFREDPPVGEYATLRELVAQMLAEVSEPKVRDQLDCFARRFAVEPAPPVESPWTLATTYDLGLALNRGH